MGGSLVTACTAHWWVLTPTEGVACRGVCKRCGDVREFTGGETHDADTFRQPGHRKRGREFNIQPFDPTWVAREWR